MKYTRLTTISISISIFFAIALTRFFYWQVIRSGELSKKSMSQFFKMEKINPSRGKIYSSDAFPLVQNQTLYQISIYKPELKADLNQILQQLSSIHPGFDETDSKLITKIKSDSAVKWVTFNTLFSRDEIANLENTPGLVIDKQILRFYPEASLAKNILGLLAKNDYGQTVGYEGLEGYYNKQLQGKTGYIWQAKDAKGKTLMTKENWLLNALNGRDVHTSLNRSIQFIAENTIKAGVEKYQADSGSISIIEPATGNVLALAYYQAPSNASSSAAFNPIISKLFEPGSIFKPLIIAMALDSKSISSDYVCTKCDRPLSIGEYTISNWNDEVHPDSTIQDIIKNSDNIGMSHIIRQMGQTKFLSYFQKMGLNRKTGIDLQGEARPQTKTVWPEIDLATASFGQGIALTPINMLQAFNTLANDGVLKTPSLVEYFTENDKKLYPKPKREDKIFSVESVKVVKTALKNGVENGTVAQFKPKNMEVCAKSGTAQVAVKGSYTNDKTIASYIGFSPCDNPKFTMLVSIDNPRTSPWGAQTAAPIWFELANRILPLLSN